jgi:hypothetical protein
MRSLYNSRVSKKGPEEMICQSNFDNEEQARFRQADDCIENWWEPQRHEAAPSSQEEPGPSISQKIVGREARRRGLVRREDEGDEFVL